MGVEKGAYSYLECNQNAHNQQINATDMGYLGGMGSQYCGSSNLGYSQAQNVAYTPETEEQREARRIEREARIAEELAEKQRKEALWVINKPKMLKCYAGAYGLLAVGAVMLMLNMSFHNTDYNTTVGSALMWLLQAILMGLAAGFAYIGNSYRKAL